MKKNLGAQLALFQFPTYEYLETGDVLGSCMKMN